MSIVGMTGTQIGMTPSQKSQFAKLLIEYHCTELHHGDCIGADKDAHDIATELDIWTVIHPPENPYKRAWCKGDEIRACYPYIDRNHHIVSESTIIIGVPKSSEEELRSGTWATIRYARKQNKKLIIIT